MKLKDLLPLGISFAGTLLALFVFHYMPRPLYIGTGYYYRRFF